MGIFANRSELLSSGTTTVKDMASVSKYIIGKKNKAIFPVNLSQEKDLNIFGKNSILYSITSVEEKSFVMKKIKEAMPVVSGIKKTELYLLNKALESVDTNYIDLIFMQQSDYNQITLQDLKKVLKQIIQNLGDFYGVVTSPYTTGVNEGRHCFYPLGNQFKELMGNYFNGYMLGIQYTPYKTIGLDKFCLSKEFYRKLTGATYYQNYDVSESLLNDTNMAIIPDTFFSYGLDNLYYNSLDKKVSLEDDQKVFEEGIEQKSKTFTSIVPAFYIEKYELENVFDKSRPPLSNFSVTNTIVNNEEHYTLGSSQLPNKDFFLKSKIYVFDNTATGNVSQLIYPSKNDNYYIVFTGSATLVEAAKLFNSINSGSNKEKFITNVSLDSSLVIPEWSIVESNIDNLANKRTMDHLAKDILINGKVINADMTEVVIGSNFSYEIYQIINNFFLGDITNTSKVLGELELRIKSRISTMVEDGIINKEAKTGVTVIEYHGNVSIEAFAYDEDTGKNYVVNISL